MHCCLFFPENQDRWTIDRKWKLELITLQINYFAGRSLQEPIGIKNYLGRA
jgi:hypothetical protein